MIDATATGRFCWVDLAASDASLAKAFYGALFGWQASEVPANGGVFTQLSQGGRAVGSLYPLNRRDRDAGVPSHWTPYVAVVDIEAAARRTVALGGRLLVRPFAVSGVARIALVADAVGAPFGLWQGDGADAPGRAHG